MMYGHGIRLNVTGGAKKAEGTVTTDAAEMQGLTEMTKLPDKEHVEGELKGALKVKEDRGGNTTVGEDQIRADVHIEPFDRSLEEFAVTEALLTLDPPKSPFEGKSLEELTKSVRTEFTVRNLRGLKESTFSPQVNIIFSKVGEFYEKGLAFADAVKKEPNSALDEQGKADRTEQYLDLYSALDGVVEEVSLWLQSKGGESSRKENVLGVIKNLAGDMKAVEDIYLYDNESGDTKSSLVNISLITVIALVESDLQNEGPLSLENADEMMEKLDDALQELSAFMMNGRKEDQSNNTELCTLLVSLANKVAVKYKDSSGSDYATDSFVSGFMKNIEGLSEGDQLSALASLAKRFGVPVPPSEGSIRETLTEMATTVFQGGKKHGFTALSAVTGLSKSGIRAEHIVSQLPEAGSQLVENMGSATADLSGVVDGSASSGVQFVRDVGTLGGTAADVVGVLQGVSIGTDIFSAGRSIVKGSHARDRIAAAKTARETIEASDDLDQETKEILDISLALMIKNQNRSLNKNAAYGTAALLSGGLVILALAVPPIGVPLLAGSAAVSLGKVVHKGKNLKHAVGKENRGLERAKQSNVLFQESKKIYEDVKSSGDLTAMLKADKTGLLQFLTDIKLIKEGVPRGANNNVHNFFARPVESRTHLTKKMRAST